MRARSRPHRGVWVERTRGAVASLKAVEYRIFSVSDSGEEHGFVLPA